jgi:hypothetical protein
MNKLTATIATALLLTGCVSPPPHDPNYCGYACQAELREQRRAEFVSSGSTYGAHQSQEYRDAMAETRRNNDEWVQGDRSERISESGPILTAYGEPGKSGYPAVARCKIDVGFAIPATELDKRTQFDKACYDLLPPQHRENIYQADQRVPGSGATIVIIID